MATQQQGIEPQSAGIEQFGYKQELRRSLSFTDLLFYALIFMVPIAPFGIFGDVYKNSGGMVVLAYVVGAVAMMFTAFSYAQMSGAFPMAGSVYSYAGRGIGAPVGFLAGWLILLDYILVPSLLYLIASSFMAMVVPSIPTWLWLIGFVGFNTVINFLGIKLTAVVTKVMLIGELIVLAIFLVVGVIGLVQGKGHGSAMHALYNSDTFTWQLVFSGVSVAVLSFLGFDGVAMLAEENRGQARQIGRSMIAALALAALLFVVQTWVATMYVVDPAELAKTGDDNGPAFYAVATTAGGHWLAVLTALTTAIAWGFADSLVAQVATSRLLYAMSRDRQLPKFLSKIDVRRGVPIYSVLLVGAIALGLGEYMATRADGVTLLVSWVNFGALSAFMILHVAVMWHFLVRKRSRDLLRHLLLPLIGFAILGYVVYNRKVAQQLPGFIWLGIGVLIVAVLYAIGRRPKLSGLEDKA